MQQVLKDCLSGKLLSRSEAIALCSTDGDNLQALIAAAAELRDRHKGRVVTFSPKVFVPLTNL